MRPLLLKFIFLVWLLWLAGCGSAKMPPQMKVAELALVANLDASSVSTFNVSTPIVSMGNISTGACLSPRYLEVHPTNGLLYATCQSSNTVVGSPGTELEFAL